METLTQQQILNEIRKSEQIMEFHRKQAVIAFSKMITLKNIYEKQQKVIDFNLN